ncbi:LytTR family DNA-binding domain-containing protein [Massilia sp. CF038]|uniref:LytR/AlgR family response regulator transcription factor n=1 Tax=Massilia sp. CF038 TaxID=1881045 RepID=UPI00091F4602|nr:LytTR family DNA-binding domain-containing protein [Massilia sp. CF038]SHH01072.1 two component transcriptional regulator, LytTR family [Massilia sp. CF038]
MIKCVIAEDEILLRDALVEQLAQVWPELEIVAVCDDGGSALEAIAEHRPQVAFLDIRMPGLTGLEVAAALPQASPQTQAVFVTAYDQYALDAFDRGAVDYLLKPVARPRLEATIARIKARLASGGHDAAALAELVAKLGQGMANSSKEPPLVWLTASAGNETRLIMIEDIAYFQSDTKYTVVMTAAGEALLRKPIRELLDVLDPNIFKQIHRSTIVNLRAIASITRDETGRGIVKLRNRPETLSVSQPFMALFRNM